jgi:hypothetical protein
MHVRNMLETRLPLSDGGDGKGSRARTPRSGRLSPVARLDQVRHPGQSARSTHRAKPRRRTSASPGRSELNRSHPHAFGAR